MTTLIIRCPHKPFTTDSDSWNLEDLLFSYSFLNRNHFKTTSNLESCPVAEKVIAIMPSIDVRLSLLKLPSISAKKIQQVLPMLLEDELLSQASATEIKILPPFSTHLNEQRVVSMIDQQWLLWISQKLSVLNCEKIQLISEGLLLPSDPLITFFTLNEQYQIYTVKKNETDIVSWVQQKNDIPIHFGEQGNLKEMTWEVLQNGLLTEQKIYEYINFLPMSFLDLRKNNRTEMQHWLSSQLWQEPFKWVRYLSCTILVCYFSYFLFLIWQDRQWQDVLYKSTGYVLTSNSAYPNKLSELVIEECQATHKNNEHCSADFERLLMALQKELGNQSLDSLKSLEFNSQGLVVELSNPSMVNTQIKNDAIQRIDLGRLLVTPFAKTTHD
jgi:hypothetical protein